MHLAVPGDPRRTLVPPGQPMTPPGAPRRPAVLPRATADRLRRRSATPGRLGRAAGAGRPREDGGA
ncbi:hypothetical protein ABT279_43700, partial [Amycolatopsis sp. NPDC000673]|uniref:hypothetical protein n=1 Tax=Amycolatopsis sp. NPDC000673 TaxID=3154267 RepID=UPI00332CF9BA